MLQSSYRERPEIGDLYKLSANSKENSGASGIDVKRNVAICRHDL